MRPVQGGKFWVGSSHKSYNGEENPRFLTRVADFCMGETEVTVRAYARCVEQGQCTAAATKGHFCNARSDDRDDHPINCVDHDQAAAYCAARGARLPSEVEWEYAARGGERELRYPWGDASPDGHTCWKHAGGTCAVKTYPAGAFGLFDIIGNVWEWTSDWYAPYPWPASDGYARVYRGGSWSRRFEKWLRPQLRNRYRPDQSGSHLGFRCALTLPATTCPYGRDTEGQCRRGVETAQCKRPRTWNGVRCARRGQTGCREGFELAPGFGCQLAESEGSGGDATEHAGPSDAPDKPKAAAVKAVRSPQFDEDCQQHYPGRPRAFRYTGGTHAARNQKGRANGCKNRDVGVGWNSSCCP